MKAMKRMGGPSTAEVNAPENSEN